MKSATNCVTLHLISLNHIMRLKFLITTLITLGILLSSCRNSASAPTETTTNDSLATLREKIEAAISRTDATVGVAMICAGDTLQINGDEDFPLMSVFKLHIALAILKQADDGLISIDSALHVPNSRLRPDTYSPLREAAAGKDLVITVDELMRYSVVRSDNNACDILIDLAGGISAVNDSIRALNIGRVELTETEETMHADILRSYNNHSTPLALCTLMDRIYSGTALPPESTAYLTLLLGESSTGRTKIAAGIPEDAFLGHKSGLSDRKPDGTLIASADVATFTCSNGRRASLAILIKDAREPDSRLDSLFAEISALTYKYHDVH